MKPPIQYFGAKVNIADQIVALMPAHRGYIEPYAGSLSVLLAKPAAKIEIVNDLDQKLMTFWRVLRDQSDELLRLADLTPHSRAELKRAAALDGSSDLELARQVWVLLTQGRSRTLKRTGWRYYADPNGTNASFQTYMDAYRNRLGPTFDRIRQVSLECRPALDVINQYGAFDENLLYVDPPYLATTRAAGRYSHEMGGNADHEEMLAALTRCRAAVMISGYPSDMYDNALAGWHRAEIAAVTTNGLVSARTEVVWSNRPMASRASNPFDFGEWDSLQDVPA